MDISSVIIYLVLIITFIAVVVLSCWFATYMMLTGASWYAGAIISCLLLCGVFLMLMRIGD